MGWKEPGDRKINLELEQSSWRPGLGIQPWEQREVGCGGYLGDNTNGTWWLAEWMMERENSRTTQPQVHESNHRSMKSNQQPGSTIPSLAVFLSDNWPISEKGLGLSVPVVQGFLMQSSESFQLQRIKAGLERENVVNETAACLDSIKNNLSPAPNFILGDKGHCLSEQRG